MYRNYHWGRVKKITVPKLHQISWISLPSIFSSRKISINSLAKNLPEWVWGQIHYMQSCTLSSHAVSLQDQKTPRSPLLLYHLSLEKVHKTHNDVTCFIIICSFVFYLPGCFDCISLNSFIMNTSMWYKFLQLRFTTHNDCFLSYLPIFV